MLPSPSAAAPHAATARWAAADRHRSAATFVAGAALLLLSTLYLFSLTEREGQILGLVLMASGAAGYLGGRRKSSAAVQLQLVACLVGVLLGFGLINEVRGAAGSMSGRPAKGGLMDQEQALQRASCSHGPVARCCRVITPTNRPNASLLPSPTGGARPPGGLLPR